MLISSWVLELGCVRALLHCIRLGSLQDVALHSAGLLRGMIERETRRALDVVVPVAAERVVGADNDLLATARQLDRHALVLVVLSEGRRELRHEVRGRDCQGFDI